MHLVDGEPSGEPGGQGGQGSCGHRLFFAGEHAGAALWAGPGPGVCGSGRLRGPRALGPG